MAATSRTAMILGGSFLVSEHPLAQVFTPEEFSADERMIGELVEKFVQGSILPRMAELESMAAGVMPALLKEAGALGLLALDIPETYGGMACPKRVGMLVAEKLAASGSFQVAHGAHTGIGALPIVYFGSPAQKEKYLPRLATGELLAAYALTESGSGSDAMNARTKAVLSADGSHYILNGEKMWISNAGFADVFVVFAQVPAEAPGGRDRFSAFIVEQGTPGFHTGNEEKKMGIKGSSTRTLVFEDARVPAANVLGRIGRAAAIAINILNVGRFKLGAGAIGGAELALIEAVRYGNGRHQFGRPITEFGLIKHKLGEMAARLYAAQSMVYRTAGYIDQNIAGLDKAAPDFDAQMIEFGIREYMTECSMVKVYGSEVLDYCTDECVQIHGGYGFSQEYPAERYYRDARINRIFEGTNEINRLIIAGDMLKRAAKHQLPIYEHARAIAAELASGAPAAAPAAGELEPERQAVAQAKRATLLALGAVAEVLGEHIKDPMEHEEVLAFLSDMVTETYAIESSLLRTRKIEAQGNAAATAFAADLTRLACGGGLARIAASGEEALAAVYAGEALAARLALHRRAVAHTPIDAVALRRRVADVLIAPERWPLAGGAGKFAVGV
ncbi:acyl-CoA dehydrogenase [bacterium]|nr:acyl-CoA dehydrogenase [bacterium]